MTRSIQQAFTVQHAYAVHFTEGVFDADNPVLADCLPEAARALVVVDDAVARLHPTLLEDVRRYRPDRLSLAGEPLVLPGGESAKNGDVVVDAVVRAISERSVCRHSFVIAVGGGALLDAAGFAASIAHRGVRLVRVPTTVLAQNDSGVGVKNGVNRFGKKNFVGCFAPPFAVINDGRFLATLSDRDWRAGLAEAVKVALIRDEAFFHQLERDAHALARRDADRMADAIYRCAALHLAHIAQGGDPFESGSSRPLDFGHWAAHRLEQLSGFALRHGEAVAVGIAIDARYSCQAGHISHDDLRRILALLETLGFDLACRADADAVLEGLEEFREHLGGELTITLLEGIGRGFEVHAIDRAAMRQAIEQQAGGLEPPASDRLAAADIVSPGAIAAAPQPAIGS